MKSARYAFAAHPEALADLRNVPDQIRDLALLELQHLVHGNERGAPLTRELVGCHKVYVDPETRWRMVIQFRDAPSDSQHRREIYLVAVGERQDHTAYRLAAHRLTHERSAAPTHPRRAQAARSRSPHNAAVKPALPTPHTPSQPSPATHPHHNR
ncbi:type II toxin-antitoxin system RelE family toxin [Streptomyces sp. SDT5-1]|uniref:type II toxin-antitoxin system RelE family toxin n=1 Tax=Streptomyces sp. SDT5-1 TaxID=3406418 RepID=UPI003FD420C4